MPKNGTKKPFDKKNSVTFNLVFRSQRDPLISDETAPQRVLVPVQNAKGCKDDRKKFSVFFDDEFDYLKHLKDDNIFPNQLEKKDHLKNVLTKDKSDINLPSSVFESNIQEKVGLLNKVAFHSGLKLELDPDIVAALDDQFDFNYADNQLEDNFIELANVEDYIDKYDENSYDIDLNNITYIGNKKQDCNQYVFQDEEAKSYFTEYSISSNVIKRNKQLNLLDHKFEKMYANYDENEIGGLDGDEIEGHIESNSNVILQYAKEYERQQNENIDTITKFMQDHMKVLDREFYISDENKDKINFEKFIIKEQEKHKWDCESILSTYSNIYNNPKLILEQKDQLKINLDFKTGIPKNVFNRDEKKLTYHKFAKIQIEQKKLVKKELFQDKKEIKLTTVALNSRHKSETPTERKTRKHFIRSQRKKTNFLSRYSSLLLVFNIENRYYANNIYFSILSIIT